MIPQKNYEFCKNCPYVRWEHEAGHAEGMCPGFESCTFEYSLLRQPKEDENLVLRRLLWMRHGCPTTYLYRDDKQLLCTYCCIDFALLTPEHILERFIRGGLVDEAKTCNKSN